MDKQTVFYIEDDFDNRVLLERFLEFEGFKVYSVATGTEGLRRAAEIMPDIFLIDLNLPDINGLDVIKVLCQQSETQHIPKIVFSAGNPNRARASVPIGRIFYLEKPVNIDTLADKLRFALTCQDNRERFIL